MKILLNLILLILLSATIAAQDSVAFHQLASLPANYYDKVSGKLSAIEKQLNRKTERYLRKIVRQEEKIYDRLVQEDSVKAKILFGNAKDYYIDLQNKAKAQHVSRYAGIYSGKLDSLSTAFHFLDKNKIIDPKLNDKLTGGISSVNSLQNKLNETDQVCKYLKERKQLLTSQLESAGMLRELKIFNKEVYYYQQQIAEYKNILNDPDRLEQKILGLLVKLPAFKEFFASNSQLSTLFNLPGSTTGNPAALAGLQTRETVMQDLQSRFGSGPQVQQMLQQNMQSGQAQLSALKNKISEYLPKGGNSDIEQPDFKPNQQRTKTFWQRLELGGNFQSNRSNSLLPVTSDIGVSMGYKLNDRSVIGVGSVYKMGWGKDIQHINITHQGVGLRSFLDWNIKRSFFASGGFEMNYRSEFKKVDQLRDYNAWQQSGLIGISKIVSMNSKLFKKTKMQLLWDFLSYQQVPRTQPVIFRLGYSFK